MLAGGTLGPQGGVGRAPQAARAQHRLVLDRAAWTVEASTRPAAFAPSPGADDAQQAALEQALAASCAALALDRLKVAAAIERWL